MLGKIRVKIIIPVLFITMLSCGSATDLGEDYGDILDSPSGLVLTESEHTYGWGRDDCLVCHNLNNIHQEDRSGLGIDMEALQETVIDGGEESCSDCHGSNGI